MRGTWSRRVFGRVIKGDNFTLFTLEISLSTGVFKRLDLVENEELHRTPGLYKQTLDELTQAIQLDINNSKKTSSNES